MKTVKVNFVDFYEGQDKENNHLMNVLREKYNPVLSGDPDYVFCGPYISPGRRKQEFWKYDGIRIFSTDEAVCPDFNLYDYAIGFDELNFGDRYLRYPNYAAREDDIKRALESRSFTPEDLRKKENFCSFVVSNGEADKYREALFDELGRYKKVLSGGRFRNNVGGPVKDKIAFQRKSRFSVACENSLYPGYTTEKIIDAYAAQTIPIYWGNPEAVKEFDERSFINCHNYGSIREAAEAVIRVDQDDELYLAMMHSPVFKDGYPGVYKERLREFLFRIFDQPYEEAFRRNRSCAGRNYSAVRRKMWKLYGILNRRVVGQVMEIIDRKLV